MAADEEITVQTRQRRYGWASVYVTRHGAGARNMAEALAADQQERFPFVRIIQGGRLMALWIDGYAIYDARIVAQEESSHARGKDRRS